MLTYREFSPRPELTHALDCLWSVCVGPERCATPSHWVLPDGCYSLAVRVKGPWYIHLRKPVLTPFRAPSRSNEEIVGVRFRPGVAPGAAMRSIHRRLRPGGTGTEVLATLQDILRVEAPAPEQRIDRMIALVRAADGRIPLPAMAEAVQLSPRHLERLSLRTLGLTPKEFARVTRLQAVVRRLIERPLAPLADCAAEFGFTDQTHMTREFSILGQLTPAAYLRMIRDVGFVLENPLKPV